MTTKSDEVALGFVCEQCNAQVGQLCIGARGHPIQNTHWVRRRTARDARRKANLEAKRKIKEALRDTPVTTFQKEQADLSLRPGESAAEALKRLCLRHARVGRCILCGRGPYIAVTLYGACKDCGYKGESETLRSLVGM